MGVPSRAEVEALVSEQLAGDPGFRAELLADPRAALSELLGVAIPDSVVIEVHEESLAHFHLVIPNDEEVRDISDDELEVVAGGAGEPWWHPVHAPPQVWDESTKSWVTVPL